MVYEIIGKYKGEPYRELCDTDTDINVRLDELAEEGYSDLEYSISAIPAVSKWRPMYAEADMDE